MFIPHNQDTKVEAVFMADDTVGFGMLPGVASAGYREIVTFVAQQEAAGADQRRLVHMSACLSKLDAFLLQCKRLWQHHDDLIELARSKRDGFPKNSWPEHGSLTPPGLVWRGDEACFDFEALLLQGRATLDRLAFFISSEFKQDCDTWYKIPNILGNFTHSNNAAAVLLGLFSDAFWGPGIFRDLADGTKSLRSFVAHRGSIAESIRAYFAITYVDRHHAIIADCDSRGFPVLRTAWASLLHMPHLVVNSLRALALDSAPIDKSHFTPAWRIRTIVRRDLVRAGGTIKVMYASRMTAHSVTMAFDMVDESILEHAVNLWPADGQPRTA